MKAYSPQGTYLPEHRRHRIWKKHWAIEKKSELPNMYKGDKCYVLDMYDRGFIVFSAKPKCFGTFGVTYYVAEDLRHLYDEQA